jgi:hypothetical protein
VSLECVESDDLPVWFCATSGSCGGDLRGLYTALSQGSKLVVCGYPSVVWGLCFGKVGGVISGLVGPARVYRLSVAVISVAVVADM